MKDRTNYFGLRGFINRALVRPKVGKMVGEKHNKQARGSVKGEVGMPLRTESKNRINGS